jgi:tetratricopeptide (TPR) repeat protein
MRFGVSFAMFFILVGLISSYQTPLDDKWPAPFQKGSLGFRYASAGLWLGFLGALVFPKIMQPYRAQKEVNATPGFFNERLLDPAKSIQDLETLAVQYPHEALVLEKLAYVYAKEMKTTDDKLNLPMAEAALGVYQKLVEVDPSRVSAYNNMANINYTMGRHNEAISLWKKCVEIDPNFLDAHLNLGKTLYVRGDLKESAAHLEKVLELQPGNAEAIVYLKRMVE